ncbi:MAG: thiamine diphosphokinase [Clostridia bacterium]|nr:thiamine diphosphokinase [Clostridia bacterium]
MKGILLLNGDPPGCDIDTEGAVVYCCDGAYGWAKDKYRIDKNVGDFDSLGYIPEPKPERIYPSEKDFTDGEIAVSDMARDGVDFVEIYGAGGGRVDHFAGNLHLLYKCRALGMKAFMHLDDCVVFISGGEIKFSQKAGRLVSVLPFKGDARIEEGKGFKYEYPDALRYGTCRGISNVITDDEATLKVGGEDLVLIVLYTVNPGD